MLSAHTVHQSLYKYNYLKDKKYFLSFFCGNSHLEAML